MPSDASVTTWVHQLKHGEPAAAQQIWERYFGQLVGLARDRLRGLPRRVSDEEDVALSAFQSFCVAVGKGRFPRLDNREDLWQLLIMHTARKAVAQRRYLGRLKRGGELGLLEGAAAEAVLEQVIGHEPDPEFAAEVADQLEHLLKSLGEAELRSVAVARLEGYTAEEIAQQTRLSLRTVKRKLALIRRIWEQPGPQGEAG